MNYNVIVTRHAEEQLDNIIRHIIFQLKNEQAASNVLDDVYKTYERLEYIGGSLQLCNDPYLAAKGYYKIALEKHDYLLLYQVRNSEIIVNGIFHMLENYHKRL